jgi:diamine N-acetyltransferase
MSLTAALTCRIDTDAAGSVMIKEITTASELVQSAEVIQQAFKPVADEFNLTLDNCPTHPSFITYEKLLELKKKGLQLFGMFIDDSQIGFIAIEKSSDDLFFIEKLAVLPHYRHQLFGTRLVWFALEYIKKNHGTVISIGIINEHAVLKQWYWKLGFKEINRKKYDHLPFTVCFMEIRLQP